MKKSIIKIAGFILLTTLAVSCAVKAEPASMEPVLKLTGAASASWSEDDLKALPVIVAEYTNKDGETTIYTGVAFAELFKAASVGDFTSLTLVAADGYTVEVTSDELSGCPTCIVAFQEKGGLNSVMPDFSGKLQVRDLVEIQVN